MKKPSQFVTLGTGAALLLTSFLSSGCASDGSTENVLVIAVQNAVDYRDLGVATSGNTLFRSVGGSVGTKEDRRVQEIQYERKIAEQTAARERAEEEAQRQRMISQGKSVEDQELLEARQQAEAAEAEVARLKAEEDAAIRKAKQLQEYKEREAAAKAEAARMTGTTQ